MKLPFARPALGAAAVGLLVSFAVGVSAADRPTDGVAEWLAAKGEFYAAHPERAETRGSGWKPYNRAKWFYEQRLVDGLAPAPDARWKVWEQKRELERRHDLGRGGSPTWFSLGPTNFSGRILDIEFDPTNTANVYVGTASGGLWKSTDAGSSWLPISDEIPTIAIGAVCVLPWAPNTILIGTGEGANGDVSGVGILKSTDGGTTWGTTDRTQPIESLNGFHAMVANPTTHTILAGDKQGLWRSTDDGDTWLEVTSNGDYFDVVYKPGDPNTAYCVKGESTGGNNVKISTDDGLTWTKAGNGQPPSFVIGKSKIAVSPDQPEWIYALFSENSQNGNTTGVYLSTDGGANWTAQNTTTNIAGGQGWYNLSLAADPNDATRVIAGGVELFRSQNSGVTFSVTVNSAIVHVDHHAIAYEPDDPDAVWVGSDGGVWRSHADGNSTTWSIRSTGIVSYQFYDICVNNEPSTYYIMGGTQDQGTDKWSGTTFWSEGLGGDGMVCHINPVNGNTVFAETQFGGLRKNTNSGGAGGWASIVNGFTGTKAWVTPWAEDQLQGNHLYAASSAGIFETENGGTNWVNVSSNPANWIDFSDFDSNTTWTVGAFATYTTDHGVTWTQCSPYGFSAGGGTKILAHPTDLASAFVTFSGYGAVAHVALTTDFGVTWSDVSGDFPSQPVNAIAVDPEFPDDWYIGTDVGIWKSSNGGVNWLPWDNGFPNVVVSDLEIRKADRKLVAGTYGRGAWEMDLPPTGASDVAIGIGGGPASLMLDSPRPNPVRGGTLLRWASKVHGSASLEIYDVSGRLVSSLAEIAEGDGIVRETPWLTDDVTSGVYFAVVRTASERLSRKMVVAK
ncbi:MAG: T9SS type A sorting domain-containing protein [bacterium]